MVFIAILFMLPEVSSGINRDTFNYAPIAVGVVLLFAGVYWLVVPANGSPDRKPRATGPAGQIEAEFAHIEQELEEVD